MRWQLAMILAGAAVGFGQVPMPRPGQGTGWPTGISSSTLQGIGLDTHAGRLGASIAGRPYSVPTPGVRPPRPIYIAPGGGYFMAPPMMPMPSYVVVPNQVNVVQQQQPAPQVVSVNPDYVPDTARPVMREYSNVSQPYAEPAAPAAPAPAAIAAKRPGGSVTLIALKNGTLTQAVAYWYEADKLHYVRPDHKIESIAVSELDRESSRRFNEERGLSFRFPE